MKRFVLSVICSILFTLTLFAQSHDSMEPHSKDVTQIIPVPKKNGVDFEFYTASKDGFVIRWTSNNGGQHYQLSDIGVSKIAASPDGRFVAVYETDGGSLNRISVWEWKSLTKVFTKKYSDTVNSIAFSAQGTYLIVGTSTMDAVEFFRTKDWIKVPNVIESNSSIISYIYTSDTEKTALFYSTSGTISYFNLKDGSLKLKKTLIPGLTQCVLYNNSMYFAGVKDNKISIFNATNGKLLKEISSYTPIILSNDKSFDLYYLEADGRGGYSLKVVKTNEDKSLAAPVIVKTFKGPKGTDAICSGMMTTDNLYFGAKNGTIYKIDTEENISSPVIQNYSTKEFEAINAIEKNDNYFYILAYNALYKGTQKSGVPEKVCDINGQNGIITIDNENVVLFTKGAKGAVVNLNVTTGAKTTLFNTKNPIQHLKYFNTENGAYLVEVENSSSVNVYDFTKKTYKEMYSGSGVQDAVITSDKMLYVSKSANTNPKSPLICVDLSTYETAATTVNGEVCFNLTTDGNNVFGIVFDPSDGTKTTYVFCYDTKGKKAYNMLKFDEEDIQAFVYYDNEILYSNIGKGNIYCYNLKTKNRYTLNRSASLPKAICQNEKMLLLLNDNGSITWMNTGNANIVADWYYSTESMWIEF